MWLFFVHVQSRSTIIPPQMRRTSQTSLKSNRETMYSCNLKIWIFMIRFLYSQSCCLPIFHMILKYFFQNILVFIVNKTKSHISCILPHSIIMTMHERWQNDAKLSYHYNIISELLPALTKFYLLEITLEQQFFSRGAFNIVEMYRGKCYCGEDV